jgi:hypothetical protein
MRNLEPALWRATSPFPQPGVNLFRGLAFTLFHQGFVHCLDSVESSFATE